MTNGTTRLLLLSTVDSFEVFGSLALVSLTSSHVLRDNDHEGVTELNSDDDDDKRLLSAVTGHCSGVCVSLSDKLRSLEVEDSGVRLKPALGHVPLRY
jgi:hypothetical protein